MQNEFYKTLQKYNLLNSQKKILLAVSGGVDSIVLLHLFIQLSKDVRPQISIAHVNHQLREEANQEERFVRKLAMKHNVPFYVYQWDKKTHPKSGIETEARKNRYRFFKELMSQYQIPVLMTGHHQDDQIETVLMRLTRGSSLKQLTGIQENQRFDECGQLIRPLLSFSKDEIYTFAEENKILFMEDESNKELIYTRNRFREQIIPLFKNENPRFNENVGQFISDMTDLLKIAEQPIDEAVKQVTLIRKEKIILDIEDFLTYEPPLQRAILIFILKKIYKNKAESYKTNYIELIRKWLRTGEVNTHLDLQDMYQVKKDYTQATFLKVRKDSPVINETQYLLTELGQWQEISNTEKIGLFQLNDWHENVEESKYELFIDKKELKLPLKIRHRKPGDRMSYRGLEGTKKIKDIFIDEKTPIEMRNQAWIIEDNTEKIIWLIPHRKLGLFTASETDRLVYVLKYEKN